jgi:tetratricopeptide (TPR) repeat protein
MQRRFSADSTVRHMLWIVGCLIAGVLIAWPNHYGVQSLEFPRLATNRARLLRSVAAQQQAAGNAAEAARWLEQVTRTLEATIARHPEDATAHLWLADMHFEAARFELARTHYDIAATLEPHVIEAQVGLARLAARQKQFDTARAHYERATSAKPRDTALAIEFSEVLFRHGARQQAVDILQHQLRRPDLAPRDRQGLEQLLRRVGVE